MKNFKLILDYLKNDKMRVMLYILFILITHLPTVLSGFLWGFALEALIDYNLSEFIVYLLLWEFLAILCHSLLSIPRDWLYYYLENKFTKSVMKDLYSKMLSMPAIAFEKLGVGELINRLITDPKNVISLLASIVKLGCNLIVGVVVLVIAFSAHFIVGIEVIIFGIIMYLITIKFLPSIKKSEEVIKKESDIYTKKMTETLSGIREIKALNIKGIVQKSIYGNFDVFFKENYNVYKKESLYYAMNNLAYFIMQTIILLTSGYFMINGKLSFAMFSVIEMSIWRLDQLVAQISDVGVKYSKITVSLNRIDEILNNKLYKDELFGTDEFTNIKGEIAFNDVYFKYDDDENYTLNGLSLKFSPSNKIAIVGRSGNGKTTLFNLLLRYFDSTKGSITIDGKDIRDLSESALRDNISIIRQNPFLFNLSIFENFKMVDESVTMDKVIEVCKKAYIHDYIMSLPNKYDTIIGEGGVNLSGGQKQRMAIARTLLLNTKIILFDEATSALDNESQGYIKKTIDDLVVDKTVIIVAHRLSTVEDADTIYVIDKGVVAGSGTKDDLLDSNEVFKTLYNMENIN